MSRFVGLDSGLMRRHPVRSTARAIIPLCLILASQMCNGADKQRKSPTRNPLDIHVQSVTGVVSESGQTSMEGVRCQLEGGVRPESRIAAKLTIEEEEIGEVLAVQIVLYDDGKWTLSAPLEPQRDGQELVYPFTIARQLLTESNLSILVKRGGRTSGLQLELSTVSVVANRAREVGSPDKVRLVEYTVTRDGESVEAIARLFAVPAARIRARNDLEGVDLKAGQILRIPVALPSQR